MKTYRVTFKDTNEHRDFDSYAKASNWAQERASEIAKTRDSFVCPFIELLKGDIEMNQCDHDHATTTETRVLPIGGHGNVIVCHQHYEEELSFRRDHQKRYNSEWDFPTWESLKIYEEACK